ncbi:MAG: glycosyltransferase [Phycisphaera sp.]|nr:glycosyltransferase [Phycisphaera sp.]
MPDGVAEYILPVIWGLWFLQAGWCAYNVGSYLIRTRRWVEFHDARINKKGVWMPPAVVIVPIKGADEHFAEHVGAVQKQDYPDYRVIFVVESESDPAYAGLAALPRPQDADTPPTWGCRRVDVVVAGLAESGGQKVHNQLAAIDAVEEHDEAVVFVDADAVPHAYWLYYMVDILRRGEPVAAGTGYRWFIPAAGETPTFATCVVATINASIATLMGPWWRTRAWGGSMSITRQMIDDVDLRGHWRGALSDDYQLSNAVRESGGVVQLVPECVVESPASFTWASLWEFGRRQMRITRLYEPIGWWSGLAATSFWLAAMVSAIVAVAMQLPHWRCAAWALGVIYLFDIVRGLLRRRVAREVLGDEAVARSGRVWWVDCLLTPLVMTVHLSLYLGSALSRRVTWAGITYDIRGRTDVVIVERGR